jgi:hypothetical protein
MPPKLNLFSNGLLARGSPERQSTFSEVFAAIFLERH